MRIIAGLSLKNLKPPVWDPESPHYLPDLRAVMVSYAEFHAMPWLREEAMDVGLRKFLRLPPGSEVRVYLDNGSFSFISRREAMPEVRDYMAFVRKAKPYWHPIPQEWIPAPMARMPRRECLRLTTASNRRHIEERCVPVVHIGPLLEEYMAELQKCRYPFKKRVALGGIVPNLLRTPKAMSYARILEKMFRFREEFRGGRLHVFGVGGTATVHLAALVGFDSVDSSGWRNRAARGIVQLPGKGDRMVADLGSWRGRKLSGRDKGQLRECLCPVCRPKRKTANSGGYAGWLGLKKHGIEGFCNRATHNLWVLLQEAEWADAKIRSGEYADEYESRLDNSTYLPLVRSALAMREERARKRRRRVGN